ncbi:cytochrome c oxidase assembly protein [Pseudonocardia sp. GCM10023141]|uniref:cytochrome c oxidase assembly protein n=1 Tax=Pseudonocardia sp. GCM10023141 TaxID=3252653 RepID=UPI00360E507E
MVVAIASVLPPFTLARAFTAWTAAPGVLAGVGLTGGGYLGALRRRDGPWPRARTLAFLGGLVSVLLVTVTFVGVYAGTLFWDRALQNVVLLTVTPMLLALGAPVSLLRDVLPAALRARLGAARRSRVAHLLTFPVVVTLLLVAPLPVLYLTPLYEATLRSGWVAVLAGLGLLVCGFGYFWTRLRLDPTPRTDPYMVTVAITLVEVVADGALGLALWLGPLIAPAYYAELARGWGPSVRVDQIIGAGVLWIGGDIAGLPFLGAVLMRMARESEREAAVIDAELDAADAAAAAHATASGHDEAAADARPQLWWELDPELAMRIRRDNGG